MFRWWMAAGLAALAACSSDKTAGPQVAASLALVTQPAVTPQSGAVLVPQPVVELRDARGNPVAAKGVLVSVSVTGGGSLAGLTDIRTDASGRAAYTDLAIAGTVGERTLRFISGTLTPALSDPVMLGAGPPHSAAPTAGNNQTAAAGTDLGVAPAVLVADGSGNPVAGTAVVFAVTAGGGVVQGGNALTGANGIAAVGKWTLGTSVGANSLKATVTGGLEVSFSATGTVGLAAKLVVASLNNQSAVVATAVDSAPAVKVFDAFDNPVPGLSVTFVVATGGGTLTSAVAVSDASGTAKTGAWTLGYGGGPNTATASRTGVAPVTFSATGLDFKVTTIEAGANHTCATTASGAYCWGLNATGQIGDGGTTDDSVPTKVAGGLVFIEISAGDHATCGLIASGAAYCWGDNTFGELGDSSTTSSNVPVKVHGGLTFASISVGQGHVCALTPAGVSQCWGANANGRLGDNTTVDRPVPTAVLGGHIFTMISAGFNHTCGLRNDGLVLCWGQGNNGRIGDGSTVDRRVPTLTSGSTTFTAVSAGGSHTCALATGGAAYCWGLGSAGAIGTGSTASVSVPTGVVGGLTFTTLLAAETHSCGLVGGDPYCWGLNTFGELGDGTTTTRVSPIKVTGQGLSFVTVSPGAGHTCLKSTSGAGYCVGRNDHGMLGTGLFSASIRKLVAVHP